MDPVNQSSSPIENRLRKNWNQLKSWADRNQLEAWRLYHWDIPEYPLVIDVYKDHIRVSDRSQPDHARDAAHVKETLEVLRKNHLRPHSELIVIQRRPQLRNQKYTQAPESLPMMVQEGPLRFKVDLKRYVDTGLFLDHRPFRAWLVKSAKDQQVLNLFGYTGSLSVAAAFGGASVTHVDLSRTYVKWAKENFVLNDLDPSLHRFIEGDVLNFLAQPAQTQYDWIILDPPTFSNSKAMSRDFDVQRDHLELIDLIIPRMKVGGTLFFSGNKKGFKLDQRLESDFQIEVLTEKFIPKDFQGKKTQFFYKLVLKG